MLRIRGVGVRFWLMGGVVEGFDTTLIRENGSRAALKERSFSFWKK